MEKKLEEYLYEYIEKRVSEISIDIKKNESDYIKIYREIKKLEESLVKSLTEEQKSIFLEYENIMNTETGLIREKLYRVGLIDGLRICNTLNEIQKIEIDGLLSC